MSSLERVTPTPFPSAQDLIQGRRKALAEVTLKEIAFMTLAETMVGQLINIKGYPARVIYTTNNFDQKTGLPMRVGIPAYSIMDEERIPRNLEKATLTEVYTTSNTIHVMPIDLSEVEQQRSIPGVFQGYDFSLNGILEISIAEG